MQQARYVNVKAFEALKSKDFALVDTQKEHELLTEQMLRLWALPVSGAICEFSYVYDESIWESNRVGLRKVYRIGIKERQVEHFLSIDLDKPLLEATQVRIQLPNSASDFIRVNVFNTEFI